MATKLFFLVMLLAVYYSTIQAAVSTTTDVAVETKASIAVLIEITAKPGAVDDTLHFSIDSFPFNGQLFQAPSGWEKGEAITPASPQLQWTSGNRTKVWYEPNDQFTNQIDSFTFKVDDGHDNSTTGTVSVSVFESCPNLYQPESQWGQINGAPTPTVSIQYNQTTQEFNFDVIAAYTRGATWVIDFADFNINSDKINNPTNCENRRGSDFTGSFADFWNSAPVATFDSALGGGYLTYPSANIWALSANGCDKVKYTTKTSFSKLLSCQTHQGAGAVTASKQAGTPFTDYTGTLYVQLITPLTEGDSATTYQKIAWTYPFSFRFNMVTNVVTTALSQKDLSVKITSLTLNNAGNMVLKLRTQVTSGHLTLPILRNGPNALNVTQDDSSNDNLIQEWEYVSQQVKNTNYDGQYIFEWTFSPKGEKAVAVINIQMKAQTLVNSTFTLNTQLETYKDASFLQLSSGPFGSGTRVWVKDSLKADAADANNFEVAVTNAWLCYSDNLDFIPEYNPTASSPKYGCSKPIPGVMEDNHIIQLISEKAPVVTGVQENFEILLHSFTSSYMTGFSFLAQPLSLQPRVYYIHAETLITQKNTQTKRQSVMITRSDQLSGSGNALNSIYFFGAEVAASEEYDSSSGIFTPLVSMIVLLVFLLF